MHYLIVPGYTGSGPDHWQTHLANTYAGFSRVVQDDWRKPDADVWTARLDETIRDIDDDVFLIGHSCGSVTVAQWAATHYDQRVVGAVLVAPADVDASRALPAIRPQGPLPQGALALKTHLVVSDNDPHLSLPRALTLARTWGSTVETIAGGGHLNSSSGFGQWDHIVTVIENQSGRRLETAVGRAYR
ncbi:RBBP9/YdeN family alpha/beta hydrolase [Lentzea sp. JNUCC 0626]|uniref:RBBP9/YdeN family alpha/beta hydrolase n=1 Tax=Lentzea sp. JNUCC 0626 TaxID=3367513 RepID=UPI003747F359